MSDLGDIDKTLRSGDADHDMTLRPADSADKTLRTEQQKDIEIIARQRDMEYLIGGLNYKVIDILSEGTGEAQIFLVENKKHTDSHKINPSYQSISKPYLNQAYLPSTFKCIFDAVKVYK